MVHDRLTDAFVVTVGDAAGRLWPTTPFPVPTPTPHAGSFASTPFPFPFPFPPQGGGGAATCPAGAVHDALLQTA